MRRGLALELLLASPILIALLALVRVIYARGEACSSGIFAAGLIAGTAPAHVVSNPRLAGMLAGLLTVASAGFLVMTALPACPAH